MCIEHPPWVFFEGRHPPLIGACTIVFKVPVLPPRTGLLNMIAVARQWYFTAPGPPDRAQVQL